MSEENIDALNQSLKLDSEEKRMILMKLVTTVQNYGKDALP